jgi:hypothetical protein
MNDPLSEYMSPYPIDKNFPMPSKSAEYRQPRKVRKWPFFKMNVGDSIFVPETDPKLRGKIVSNLLSGVRSSRLAGMGLEGAKFTTRQSDKGVTFWRVR